MTIEDLLNAINGSGADVLASINAAGTGIDVRSRLSGAEFSIGENGGTTATQLGIRTLTESTALAALNHGAGVDSRSKATTFRSRAATARRSAFVSRKGAVASARLAGAGERRPAVQPRVGRYDGQSISVAVVDSGSAAAIRSRSSAIR